MSKIKAASLTGLTLYANIINSAGLRWNGSIFDAFNVGRYDTYDIALTEDGTSGIFTADFPSSIVAGNYDVFFYRQAGASPTIGDIVVGSARISWDGSEEIADVSTETSVPKIKSATASGRTVYGIILNVTGQRYNTSDQAFEDYVSANYGDYVVAMTEDGTSGVYIGTFPSSAPIGTQEVIFYIASSGSATEGDPVVGNSVIAWSGLVATGLQLRNYIVRIFKRTDKDAEIYEAISDTIRELRRRFKFIDDETEIDLTDTIGTLGDFRLDVESDFGLFVGDIVIEDTDQSYPLEKLSKPEFDRLYPNPGYSSVSKSKPVHWSYFENQIWLGPVPDSTDYVYRMDYTSDDNIEITSATGAVPYFTKYRELLRSGVMSKLFEGLEKMDLSQWWQSRFEFLFNQSIAKEERNREARGAVVYNDH